MKKCKYCGKEYPDEATNCDIDNEVLVPVNPEPETHPPKPPEPLPSEEMIFAEVLFSFSGRINRLTYWIADLFPVAFSLIALLLLDKSKSYDDHSLPQLLIIILAWVMLIGLVILPTLAIGTKRMHDLGLSGWYMMILLIPYIGPIMWGLWAGCSRGTFGPNKYGPDPLRRRLK